MYQVNFKIFIILMDLVKQQSKRDAGEVGRAKQSEIKKDTANIYDAFNYFNYY